MRTSFLPRAVADLEEPMTIGDDYRYVGPDGLYLYNIVVLTILVSLFLVIREVRAHASTLAMLERIAFCLAIPLILLPFHWSRFTRTKAI
jgi:hypothetical protein